MASKNKEAAAAAIRGKQPPLRRSPRALRAPRRGQPLPSVPRTPPVLLEYAPAAPHVGGSPGRYRFRRGDTGGGKANSRRMLRATSTLFWAISKALFTSSNA